MGHFLHAVGVFFHHLAAVHWQFLGLAIACHVAKLFLRAATWCTIVRAAYPNDRLRYRTALGAYIAGVGVNSIVPARGGDVLKMYLVKHRLPDATYVTLTPTLAVDAIARVPQSTMSIRRKAFPERRLTLSRAKRPLPTAALIGMTRLR